MIQTDHPIQAIRLDPVIVNKEKKSFQMMIKIRLRLTKNEKQDK